MTFKKLFVACIWLCLLEQRANATEPLVLIQGSRVTDQEYERYILSHPEKSSLTSFTLKRLQNEESIPESFQECVRALNNGAKERQESCEVGLQQLMKSMISETQQQLISYMLEQMRKKEPYVYSDLLKRYSTFESSAKTDSQRPFSGQKILKNEVVLVNGLDTAVEALDPALNYHWVWISNQFYPIIFFGKKSDFLQKVQETKSFLSESSCAEKTMPAMAEQLNTTWEVLADNNCTFGNSNLVSAQLQFNSRIAENSSVLSSTTWRWVGLAASAAVAYTMKDKTMVVTLPRFK